MVYNPVIFKLKDNSDPFEIFCTFVRNWHEIDIRLSTGDYGGLFTIRISENINKLLNFFIGLNCTSISGKKCIAYNGFKYIFHGQNLLIRYDETLNHLIFLEEGAQDFYYGISADNLNDENPYIYKLVKRNIFL